MDKVLDCVASEVRYPLNTFILGKYHLGKGMNPFISILPLLFFNKNRCRIHRLHLCRGVRPPPHNECPGYDTKQSDGEVPAELELWGMRSTPSLPLLPGPLWPGVVVPDRALSMG